MRIPCPHCGERGSEEFAYFGDATVSRPVETSPQATGAWIDYLYLRDNPAGSHRELWHHIHGCRQWLTVTRNTRDHAIAGAETVARIALGSGGAK